MQTFIGIVVCVVLCFVFVKSEVYTAIFEMENLVYREKEMIEAVKKYLVDEEDRLRKIRNFVQKVENIHAKIVEGSEEAYLGHPTNAYLLIKRFVRDWPTIEETAGDTSDEDLTAVINKHRERLPDINDLDGAITAIFRIQEVFNAKASQLSNDLIPSATRAEKMSVGDVLNIAKKAYHQQKYETAKIWYDTALDVWRQGRYTQDDDKVEIFDYLSFVEYKLGNLRGAYNLTLQILAIEPMHSRAQKNLQYYAEELKKNGQLSGKRGILSETDSLVKNDDNDNDDVTIDTAEEVDWKGSQAYKTYRKLCRADPDALHNHTLSEQRQLKCWFHKIPWLRIRGIGVERLHVTPEVIYFRNVLTDSEIEVIKTVSRPKLMRAVIQHPVTGNLETADYRISKSGWLKDVEHPIVRRITVRTEHLTGLTLSTAEELQVNTYGMGGHYEPHYDHAQEHEDKFPRLGTGNRVATTLYYMSDVEMGGGTVFVNAGALVVPRKGDGVFWYNLFRNGKGNDDTRHAACPVFVGSKWVANKWIHEYGQEFRRRCTLNEWE